MPDRTFLTDAELDQLTAAFCAPRALPVATLDQMQAATAEVAAQAPGMALRAVAAGGWAYFGTPASDPAALHRARLRMVLAAFTAGLTHLCEHTRQIRPLLLSCDPPTLVCTQPACLARAVKDGPAGVPRWQHSCDGCGRHAETVSPHLSILGPLTISAHLCDTCVTALRDNATQAADKIQAVSRKSPCPCGSGRRYKHCHGSLREAS